MAKRLDTIVVGAGHAGLAVSKLLTDRGVEHAVLERDRVAGRWRSQRWDSFTLLTPNWATWLPGWHYDGDEPDGFMSREQAAEYFERFAASFSAPVREGVEVQALESANGDGYRLRTSDGELLARSVVIATGPFQSPRIPAWASELPPEIVQLHSSSYRAPSQLPDGAVLVVGTGASGQQIAADMVREGRRTYVSVGRHKSVPRRYRGWDYFRWMEHGGFYEKTAEDVPPAARRGGVSPSLTGHAGGEDLDVRLLQAGGATLLGRARGVSGGRLQLESGLAELLAEGDRAYDEFVAWAEERIHRFPVEFGDPEPRERPADPPEPPAELDLRDAGISAVVWATGFRPELDRWVRVPVLDSDGHPVHHRGVTEAPGLFITGLHWLHRLRSAFIRGAEEDAGHIVKKLVAGLGARQT